MGGRIDAMLPLRFLAALFLIASIAWGCVVFLADDLGYGDLGCFGSKEIQTPHLGHLAAEAIKLTQFYASVCAPSRCVLMTGTHGGRCRVRGNVPMFNFPQTFLCRSDYP